MHIGTHYSALEVIVWTRRDIFLLFIVSSIPTALYVFLEWHWLILPWLPIALLGTAVAFVVGFKNNASYDRTWEARRIWGAIVNQSRSWGILVKDYVSTRHAKQSYTPEELHQIHLELYNRHFAWLTALRYQLRVQKPWEAIQKAHNAEYKEKWFSVEEHESKVTDTLKPYLSENEYQQVINSANIATQIIGLQSSHLKHLLEEGLIEDFRHMELQKILVELYNQQGAAERIKNFPYPRQHATLNLWFIKIFILLVPYGMLQEFQKMGEHMVWLTVPFSMLSSWIFTTMEKIGESGENPFEGSANDIPITQMSRNIEIDLLELLGVEHNLKPIQPQHNILT